MTANATFNPFYDAVSLLKEWGFFEVLLPLLLIFLIIYAILIKTKILGNPDTTPAVKYIDIIVALVIGFLFVTETKVVAAMNSFIPKTALLMVITLFVLMLLAFVGIYRDDDKFFDKWGYKTLWILIPVILIFLGILDASGIYIPVVHGVMVNFFGGPGGTISISQDTINIGIAVLLFIGLPVIILVLLARAVGGDSGGDEP